MGISKAIEISIGGVMVNSLKNIDGWKNYSIGEAISDWCRRYSDKTAIIEDDKIVSYRELNELINKLADGFMNEGIQKGEHVILQLPNGINFIMCFFGLLKIGVVPILTLPAHRYTELHGIIKNAKPVAIIYQSNYMGFNYSLMVDELFKEFGCLKRKFEVKDGLILDCLPDIKERKKHPIIRGDELAFLSLSGGTTGIPKLIPRTHADYLYDVEMSVRRCKVTSNDVYLALLPIAHNFILGHPGFIGILSRGGEVVLCKYADINDGMEAIERRKVTILSLVPSMVKLMFDIIDDYDVSSLRLLQVGGAFFEESLAQRVIDLQLFTLQQVFGVAEGLNTMTELDDTNEIIKTSQGKPISEYDRIKIIDKDGCEVSNGQYGELLLKGLYTINSYYNNPHNDKYFTTDGFYKTGDRAMLTKEGNLKLSGRIIETINKAGEKIIPSEIESYLLENNNIKDCAVVGIPDEKQGEIICVFIISNKNLSLQDIRKFLIDKKIAMYKLPDCIYRIDKIPLTNFGKIDKKQLIKIGIELFGQTCKWEVEDNNRSSK